jgi:hypothetical protein
LASLVPQASLGKRTFLERNAITPKTKLSYGVMLSVFWAFAHDLGPVTDDDDLDKKLADYAVYLYFEGYPGSHGTRLMAAIIDQMPRFGKGGASRLPRFSRSLQAWGRLAPGQSRGPLPWLHLVIIVMCLIFENKVEMALCLLLMFTAYLRPGEIFLVLTKDLLSPSMTASNFSIRLHPQDRGVASKVRDFDDGVVLDNPHLKWLGRALLHHARQRSPLDPLFSFKLPVLRKKFEQICVQVGIADPSLYRLRHGGASFDRSAGVRRLEEIKKRGRWSADVSVKRYEKAVRAQWIEAQLAPEWLAFAAASAPCLEAFVLRPSSLPRLPWPCVAPLPSRSSRALAR